MANMIISKNPNNQEIEFMLYNIALSQTSGKFTIHTLIKEVNEHGVNITEENVKYVIGLWLNCGIIFDNATDFVINKSIC